MLQSLVTTNWLNDTLDHPDLVILHTTLIPKNESISVEVENLQIRGAQFFDLQTIFSDQHSGLPNTFPSEKQFELGCQKLGISNSSLNYWLAKGETLSSSVNQALNAKTSTQNKKT